MADFTLNAPGTTNNPWAPANVLVLNFGLKSDSTGFRTTTANYTPFAHNANYGTTITATVTLAKVNSGGDDWMCGATVRSGTNAGGVIGVYCTSTSAGIVYYDNTTGSITAISAGLSIAWAVSDVLSVTVSISGGTIAVTATRNGSALSFTGGNSSAEFATETSLAAGGMFVAGNTNNTYFSQFTGTGVAAAGGAALAGGAAAAAAVAAALTTAINASGAPAASVSATGALSTAIRAAGAATATVSASGVFPTTGAALAGAAAAAAAAATGTLTTFTGVTLTAPLYTGEGGILDPNFWLDSAPTVGTVVYYDPTFITILPNGMIYSTSNNCAALVEFTDGNGNLAQGLVVITPNLVAYASTSEVVSGALTTAIRVVGAAVALVSAAGALTSAIRLSGSGAAAASAMAALTTTIQVAGAVITASSSSGSLNRGSAPLAGTASAQVSAGASMTTAINLISAAISVAVAAGNIATQIQAAAAAFATTSASGSLSTGKTLAGAAVESTTATASMLAQVRLSGAASETVWAIGSLQANITMLGSAVASAAAAGGLDVSKQMSGVAVALESASGSLQSIIQMSGMAWTTAAARGALATDIALPAQAVLFSRAAASLTTVPFVNPPNSLADIRTVRTFPLAIPQVVSGDVPYGEFYQAPGERVWYGMNWSDWLANQWLPDTQVTVGQAVRQNPPNGYQSVCVTAGRTGARQPIWIPYTGVTIPDGTVTWSCQPVDDTSLGTTVLNTLWSSSSDISLSTGGVVDQVALVLIDTTNAVTGADYDVQCAATLTDGEVNIGRIRVKVR